MYLNEYTKLKVFINLLWQNKVSYFLSCWDGFWAEHILYFHDGGFIIWKKLWRLYLSTHLFLSEWKERGTRIEIPLTKSVAKRSTFLSFYYVVSLTIARVAGAQCDQIKIAKVYKSCPKMISLEKLKILTPLQNLPKNVVAKGFKKLPKVQKIAKSGHSAGALPDVPQLPLLCKR